MATCDATRLVGQAPACTGKGTCVELKLRTAAPVEIQNCARCRVYDAADLGTTTSKITIEEHRKC